MADLNEAALEAALEAAAKVFYRKRTQSDFDKPWELMTPNEKASEVTNFRAAYLAAQWRPIESAPPQFGVEVLLLCGWPDQRTVRLGTRNHDGRKDYYWIYDSMAADRATDKYIGTPTKWIPLPAPPEAKGEA